MKKVLLFFGVWILLFVLIFTCTKNQRTRFIGGYQRIDLPYNQRLVNAQWQNSSLWILTEEMDSTYIPKMKWLREQSSFGNYEGEIVFYEHKK